MADETPPELRPGSAFLLLLVCFVVYASVMVLGAAFAGEDRVRVPFAVGAWLLGPLAALYVGLMRHAPREPTAAALRLTRPDRAELGRLAAALLLGAALGPLTGAIDGFVAARFPSDELSPEMKAELASMALMVNAAAIVLVPVVEELFYRAFLLPRLTRTVGWRTAFVVVTVVYAMAQLDPAVIPSSLLLGAALATVALVSRTAWVPIALHVAHQVVRVLLER